MAFRNSSAPSRSGGQNSKSNHCQLVRGAVVKILLSVTLLSPPPPTAPLLLDRQFPAND
ncbi:MAG: hypothetical protein ACRC32_26670 [Chroococcidiopsis sp.]